MMLFKNDITYATGALQLSTEQDAGVKAVVHAIHDIFFKENPKAVLLIDAENAFDFINWKLMLHNMKFLCPLICTCICNCYAAPARLFIFGMGEILSRQPRMSDVDGSLWHFTNTSFFAWFYFNKRSSN